MLDLISAQFIRLLAEIFWVNIILSGDNAVVIALACRGLPPKQRSWGIALGAGVAIFLRLVFLLILGALLKWPLLKIVGAFLLLYIAVKLVTDESGHDGEADEREGKAATTTLAKAMWTVALADIVMSLDNVLAIAGVAEGAHGITEAQKFWLYLIGIGTSIPLIIAGSALITAIVARFPIFVWAGAALLGYIAGGMLATDPLTELVLEAPGWVRIGDWSMRSPEINHEHLKLGCEIAGALLVIAICYLLVSRRKSVEVKVRSRP